MELTKNVLDSFLVNKQKFVEGKNVGLPLYEVFPRFGQFVPVIPPGIQVMFTAGSGIGKSNSWVGIILLTLYRLKKKYPTKEFKYRFLISLLEDSKEDLIARLYSAILLLKYNIRTDVLELNSRRGQALPKNIEEKLSSVKEDIDDLLGHCEIVDSISNPTGLYKWG
ncbi:MAG TPA: hypothetical protein PLG47_04330, partial [Candidatus Dojkabacteria bacterium]|nr:hypothetical protein [Candidatus Dojkabacteria bacterium]